MVWGDTVRLKPLICAVVVGVVCALVFLYGGTWVFAQIEPNPELHKAWSLVAGLVGCITAGVIVAWMFPPSREIAETANDASAIAAVIEDLSRTKKGIGELSQATDKSRAELEDSGLTSWFSERK